MTPQEWAHGALARVAAPEPRGPIPPPRHIAVERSYGYVNRIRNEHKRAYAERVLRAMRSGAAVADRGPISFMAAQAVEMRLAAIWRGEP